MSTGSDPLSVAHLLLESRSFPPSSEFSKKAHISSTDTYESLYHSSIHTPEQFWLVQADTLNWIKKPSQACTYTWDSNHNRIEHTWFADGSLNISVNCLDRHLGQNKTALIWQGDREEETRHLTFEEL